MMLKELCGNPTFAYLGVGQAVPAPEIAKFAATLLSLNKQSLQSALSDTQVIADKFYGGSAPFNLIADLFDPHSLAFSRTDFVQLATLELCAESVQNARLEYGNGPIIPDFFTGHSLGLVFAAYMSGSIPDRESLREIGAFRGMVMQEEYLKRPTTLVSIYGLTEKEVSDMLPHYAKIGLINAPTLIAVGLPEGRIGELQEYAKKAGARKVNPLGTKGAFHVAMYMEKAAEKMDKFLRQYDFADITQGVLVGNSEGRTIAKADDIKNELVRSIMVPVRYTDMLRTMGDINVFIEIGPGNILSSLNVQNRIPREYNHHIRDYFQASQSSPG